MIPSSQPDANEQEPRNRTLARGFAILEAVADSAQGLTMSQIAANTALDKSTISRLCSALEELGFLYRRPDRSWVVGGRMVRFARVLESQMDLRDVALEHLTELRDLVNETVNLTSWQGLNVVYILQLDPDQDLIPSPQVGKVLPLNSTAMGRAILFALSTSARASLVRRLAAVPVEPELRLTPESAESERRSAAARGFVTIDRTDDLDRVAAALIGADGDPVGAVGVYGPRFRMHDRLAEIGLACAETAGRINRTLAGTTKRS